MLRPGLISLACLLTASAWAQSATDAGSNDAGSMVVEPRVVNPGAADSEPSVLRDLGDAGMPSHEANDAGLSALVSTASTANPTAADQPWALTAGLGVALRASYQGASPMPLDSTLTPATLAPLMTRLRVAPELHFGAFGLVIEADTATGAILGVPNVARDLPDTVTIKTQLGRRVSYPQISALELRKLYLEYKWATGAFRVGQQTSNWGLGLLANDGGKDPEAGDFGQQQFGALTYRAMLAARPFASFGGWWKSFEAVAAADLIARDNTAEFVQGDRALQAVLALRLARDAENVIGMYGVYRNQRNILVTDGSKATDAYVLDFAGRWELMKRRHRSFKVGWEIVGITGTTTQGRNDNAPTLRLAQFGAAVKSVYRMGKTSVFFDGGFASGDQNPADDRLESFRFDRDYKVGLILFDQVMAYQTARSAARASDPNLGGVPPEAAELLGTGGSVTGAWYLFPRIKYGISDSFDLYGGALFAFSTAALTDPFNTRIGGGTSLNALGGVPGKYLGTEVDLGMQARFHPVPEMLLSVTGEGGVFLPGDAYSLPGSGVMAPVAFGRVRLGIGI